MRSKRASGSVVRSMQGFVLFAIALDQGPPAAADPPKTLLEAEGVWRGIIAQCASPADKAHLLALSAQFVALQGRLLTSDEVSKELSDGFARVLPGIPCDKQDLPGLRQKFEARAATVDPLRGKVTAPSPAQPTHGGT